MSRHRLIFASVTIVSVLTIRCRRETASAPVDGGADTSVAASPCAWPAQRTAALPTPLELQALIQRCTGQALEASHPVSAVAIGAGGPVLAYAEIVGGDAGASSLIGLVDSPARGPSRSLIGERMDIRVGVGQRGEKATGVVHERR